MDAVIKLCTQGLRKVGIGTSDNFSLFFMSSGFSLPGLHQSELTQFEPKLLHSSDCSMVQT
jgi:hypothetical protein